MPNSSMRSTGATIANSTMAWDRCARISVASDRHVRVGHDMDGVAEYPVHETRDEPKAHDEDHVHVAALVGVVHGWRRQVEPGRIRVADIKDGLIQRRRVGDVLVRRV